MPVIQGSSQIFWSESSSFYLRCDAATLQRLLILERPYAAHELIKAIYVGAPDKSSGRRRESVYIEYDLIGFIPLDELMKQETA